jgi:hypothetical protein
MNINEIFHNVRIHTYANIRVQRNGRVKLNSAALSLPCSFLTEFIYLLYCFFHSFRAIKFREETLGAHISSTECRLQRSIR